jgi:hypothetical protein
MSQSPVLIGEFLQAFMRAFQLEKVNTDVESLADMLWLATKVPQETPVVETNEEYTDQESTEEAGHNKIEQEDRLPPPTPTVPLSVPQPRQRSSTISKATGALGSTVITPSAPSLRDSLKLGQSFRPLMRRVPSRTRQTLNEEATAIRIAEQPKTWMPVLELEPTPERWLSVSLVVEQSPTSGLWQDVIDDLMRLLARQGAFQNVRLWRLDASAAGQIQLFSKPYIPLQQQQPRRHKELTDPGGRHLVLLVSDAMSDLWQSTAFYDCLQDWAKVGLVALLQLLPERLWQQSALGLGVLAQLSSWRPGVANPQLDPWLLSPLDEIDVRAALKLPVITLQPESVLQWANVVAGSGSSRTAGVLLEPFGRSETRQSVAPGLPEQPLTDQERVNRFRAIASPTARRLAVLMSLVPVSLPVICLIQQTSLPEATQVHIAEVFMGGLLESVESSASPDAPSAPLCYEFIGEIRAILNQGVPRSQVDNLLDMVSQYIATKAGLTTRTFTALLALQKNSGEGSENIQVQEFARITQEVLYRLGGSHRAWVESLELISVEAELSKIENFDVELEEFEYEAAKVSFAEALLPFLQFRTLDTEPPQTDNFILEEFEYQAAKVSFVESLFELRLQPQTDLY